MYFEKKENKKIGSNLNHNFTSKPKGNIKESLSSASTNRDPQNMASSININVNNLIINNTPGGIFYLP
jgi:hypothetical protein